MLLPTLVSSIVSYTAQVVMSVQIRGPVKVTGSIPYQMDSRQAGFFGAVFWNPTDDFYEITNVEFNASTAISQVFSRVEQGAGSSYPTSGWILDSTRKVIYLPTVRVVQPHTAVEFYVKVMGNRQTESFSVQVRAKANGTDYQESYLTSQQSVDSPFSVLWLGQGPTPHFVTTISPGVRQTFYVTLQESSGRIAIAGGGTLTILVPREFTSLASIGGSGWGSATITGNKIEVSNTETFVGSYRTYAFTTTTPSSGSLYQLDVSFNGAPNEHPRGNFAIQISGSPPAQIQLYCDSYNPFNQSPEWALVGTSPYLNEVDYPSNYIHTSSRNAREGYFGFQNSGVETITTVDLEINGRTDRQSDLVQMRIYDGSTWFDLGLIRLPATFEWLSMDVTSYLNTWEKINAAQLWLQLSAADNRGHVYVDCARIRVNG